MVLDFKVLLNHHLMLTTDSQHQTLSTEMDASTLTPTKVLACGGKLNLEENTKSSSLKSEIDGTAVEED
jgi:hypothetical protein